MDIIIGITSVLVGSSIGKIIAKFAVYQKGLNLFNSEASSQIPHFTNELSQLKTLDTLSFALTLVFSFFIFLLLRFFYSKKSLSGFQQNINSVALLTPAVIFSIFVTFAGYSGTNTLLAITAVYMLLLVLLHKIPSGGPKDIGSIITGTLAGFYLMIFLRNIIPLPALSVTALFLTPLLFYGFSSKFKVLRSPLYSLLAISIFFPYNLTLLIILAIITGVLVTIEEKIPTKITSLLKAFLPYTLFFTLLFNPLFYLGTFDSIEEGFWAGWIQRLNSGGVIYRDFAAHHPPLLLSGLYLFTRIFGDSLFTLRLFFHLLQILGFIIIFKVARASLTNTFLTLGVFILILIFSSTQVRNNMEIRIGLGILPILTSFISMIRSSKNLKILSGVLTGIALMTSLETGVSALVGVLGVMVFGLKIKDIINNLTSFLIGLSASIIPLVVYLFLTNSLNKFLEYISYYPSTFSKGFQNLPMSAPVFSPLVEWRNVYGFLDTPGFVWQLSQFIIIPTLIVVFIRLLKNKPAPVIKERLILGLGLFALVASRSALARSDFYHINYVWIVAIILLGWLISEFGKSYKYIAIASLIVIAFFVKRDSLNSFMEAYLLKMQSYAIPAGQYPAYEGGNAKILGYTDFDSVNFNGLIKFLKENSATTEKIFVFPQAPEIYYLADRSNATSYDTPANFFTQHYQNEMVSEIKTVKPKFIVYSPELSPGGINVKDLPTLNSFILTNYQAIKTFGKYQVLAEKK